MGTQAIVRLLAKLRSLDVRLSADQGKLSVTAPKGVLTPELTEELKSRKAELVEFLQSQGSTSGVTAILPGVRTGRFTPASSQQRLWFLEQFDPDSVAYNIVGCLRLKGNLNRDALNRSFQEIIRRHEVLRTSIENVGGVPKAVVRPPSGELTYVSLRDVAASLQEAQLNQIAREEVRRRFDLSAAPLARMTLIELGDRHHAVVFALHHIAADGWSLGVFGEELMRLYAAFSAGEPSPLADLAIQFWDFVDWHRDHVEPTVMPKHMPYWKSKLSGSLPATEFPTDWPRPAVMTFEGTRTQQVLPAGLALRINAYAASQGVTSFVLLLSAFKILLYRFTRNPDILIGTASAGRNRPEIERLIGLFIKNLVLRTDLSGDPTVEEIMGRVKEVALNAFTHDGMPLDHLVSVLQPPRELNRSPFFQIMFVMLKFPPRKFELAGLTIEPVEVNLGTARFDVTVEISERENELLVDWEYRTDLFSADTIRSLQQLYQETLEHMLADPNQHLSQLPMLSSADRGRLLNWGERSGEPIPSGCVHEWISRQAQQRPEKTAVVFGDQRLSYGDLDRRSNLVAHKLRAAGVTPGGFVGVCTERSAEMVIALLGVWKSGGAYLPLDPEFPQDRLRFMLEDSEAGVVITEPHLLPILGDRASVVLLETLLADDGPSDPLIPVTDAKNLAYVIYTSGSTGKPKGVEIQHHAVMNFLASMQREPGLQPDDRLLAVTTLSFDIAGLELWLPLTTGAQVILAPRSAAGNGAALIGLLNSSQATVMQATPVSWRLLLESGWKDGRGLKILCGGEALPRELAIRLLDTGAELWNVYGPTETTIWSTAHRVQDAMASAIPIGKPIANTTVHLVDENMQLVPRGVPGELLIGGDGLARGYWKRPELTAERFIPSPFRAGQKLYRTGDQARWRLDGTLEYLGRGDTQVKVRGHRIELGEIESVLEQQPGVAQAVVIVREDVPGDQRLTAYIVPRNGANIEVRDLREALGAKLPEYMVPPAYMTLDTLPLTPNKKVDRKALPAPNASAAAAGTAEYLPPGNDLERRIAGIWREVLRVERVGMRDNFFDLGGHSLLVVQLQSRLAESLQLQVSLVQLFQYPTVGALAEWAERQPGVVTELAPAGTAQ